tara:strand:- start:174 stop:629 length:456 start_codon:yes stop_codon:yes gene_type:complete
MTELGGGIRGVMPQHIPAMTKSSDFAKTRFVLRNGWNTGNQYDINRAIGSFRAVTNSGDYLSRQNYSCGGGNQVGTSRPGLFGLQIAIGSVHSNCDGTGIPPSTCNVKYVYDGSDYTRFRKQQAMNRNYNDRSFGGDQSHASQVALKAIRR